MSKLYQCPYCPATKCQQTEPCNGCETWAEAKMIPCTNNEALKQELIEAYEKLTEDNRIVRDIFIGCINRVMK